MKFENLDLVSGRSSCGGVSAFIRQAQAALSGSRHKHWIRFVPGNRQQLLTSVLQLLFTRRQPRHDLVETGIPSQRVPDPI